MVAKTTGVTDAGNVFVNGDDNTAAFYGEHGCDESILTTLGTLVVRHRPHDCTTSDICTNLNTPK